MRDFDRTRRGYDHVDNGWRYERRELHAGRLDRRLVTRAHLALRRLVGLVVRALALVRIGAAAADSLVDHLQLRERHAEGEQDRDEDGHVLLWADQGASSNMPLRSIERRSERNFP